MKTEETSIEGVIVHDLVSHIDDRGSFTEIYRETWLTGFKSIQWNIVTSKEDTLRGVHVHKDHYDYLMVLSGKMLLGLHDIRRDSPTIRTSQFLDLSAENRRAVSIPPGVCHGFYFPQAATHLYSVSTYFDPTDELGCKFDCPELNLSWPTKDPILSNRDRTADNYSQMLDKFYADANA
ncbi:dTDP-4-dehydrorhamnose 3,5-epimerase family protein [Roseibium algicola]|uniref:dTDP-4-dehydrorhamnose 3,5-epimerase family protein n=1 Tax=Roseibium algicola TaxID=2857014 RepID=UPI003459076E